MRKYIPLLLIIFTLLGCSRKQVPDVPEVGSATWSDLMEADDPVNIMVARLRTAMIQQNNPDIIWEKIIVKRPEEEEIEENGVLAYFYLEEENLYFALEVTGEMSLTLTDDTAQQYIGGSFEDLVTIFIRTAEPNLDFTEAGRISNFFKNLNEDKQYTYIDTNHVSFEYARNGQVPFKASHFTDDLTDDTIYFGAVALPRQPIEE